VVQNHSSPLSKQEENSPSHSNKAKNYGRQNYEQEEKAKSCPRRDSRKRVDKKANTSQKVSSKKIRTLAVGCEKINI